MYSLKKLQIELATSSTNQFSVFYRNFHRKINLKLQHKGWAMRDILVCLSMCKFTFFPSFYRGGLCRKISNVYIWNFNFKCNYPLEKCKPRCSYMDPMALTGVNEVGHALHMQRMKTPTQCVAHSSQMKRMGLAELTNQISSKSNCRRERKMNAIKP